MAEKKNDSLWNWLGRQIGHVKKAVKTDVTKPKELPAEQGAKPQPTAEQPKVPPTTVIYRDEKVEEVEHPQQPGVVLRRTVIDEAIVKPEEKKE
jgi:hypothetical protein